MRNNEVFLSVSGRSPADGKKLLEKGLGLEIGARGGRLGVSWCQRYCYVGWYLGQYRKEKMAKTSQDCWIVVGPSGGERGAGQSGAVQRRDSWGVGFDGKQKHLRKVI